jgi:colicin import membrane protein
MTRHWITMAVLATFAFTMHAEAAKRAGGGKDSGTERPAATSAKKKGDEEVQTKRSSGPAISINRTSQGAPSQPSAVVPAVAGVAAGAALATAARSSATAPADATEAARKQGEEKLKKAIEEEEKAKAAEAKRDAALAEREKQEAEERKRIARVEAEKKAKAEKEKREAACQFKPVMSDEDIANCRTAYAR